MATQKSVSRIDLSVPLLVYGKGQNVNNINIGSVKAFGKRYFFTLGSLGYLKDYEFSVFEDNHLVNPLPGMHGSWAMKKVSDKNETSSK